MNKLKILLLSLICLFPLAMSATKTVYFENSENWDVVKIHYWNNGFQTTWPGVECTNISGTNIYYAVIGDDITGMLFNSRGDDDKSGNVTGPDIVDGHIYHYTGINGVPSHEPYTGTPVEPTEPTEPTEPDTDLPELYLIGAFCDWTFLEENKLELDAATKTYTITKSEFGLGAFKIAGDNYKPDFSNGSQIELNADAVTITNAYSDMSLSAAATNVTFTFVYTSNTSGTLKVEGIEKAPVYKAYTFYYENTTNWSNVQAYVWDNSEKIKPFGDWNDPKGKLTNTVNINGKTYYVGSFKELAGIDFKIIFHDNGQTADLQLVHNGIYNNGGYTRDVHSGAVIFGIEPQTEGILHADGTLVGEIAANEFKIKINTTEHHTVHYAFTPSSPAAAPTREAAEGTTYEEAPDGVITVPATTGSLAIVTHDGEDYSDAHNVEVRVSDTTGIEDIMVEGNEAVEYYNLQGVRVANPTNGLYIVRRGNTATKQYIR